MNTRKFSGDMADQVEKDRDQLIDMKEVLSWASENVWLNRWPETGEWTAYPLDGSKKWHHKPTLYEALYTAWEKRDE